MVAANATAAITLAGVKITHANVEIGDGYSGIDLGSGATLNITPQSGSSNVIIGGTATAGLPVPGIHAPEGLTLAIDGNGSLTVTGGAGDSHSAAGIGGNMKNSGAGESCGNVIVISVVITVHSGKPTYGIDKAVDIGGGSTGNGRGGDGEPS